MKTLQFLCLALGCFLIKAPAIAQDEEETENPAYHYVCAEVVSDKTRTLYITPVVNTVLYVSRDYSVADYFVGRAEEQYLYFLSTLLGNDSARFVAYEVFSTKPEAQLALDARVKSFKAKKYKIKWVKKFKVD